MLEIASSLHFQKSEKNIHVNKFLKHTRTERGRVIPGSATFCNRRCTISMSPLLTAKKSTDIGHDEALGLAPRRSNSSTFERISCTLSKTTCSMVAFFPAIYCSKTSLTVV